MGGVPKALGALMFGQVVQIVMADTGRSFSEVRRALAYLYERDWKGRPVEMRSVLDLSQAIIDHLNEQEQE